MSKAAPEERAETIRLITDSAAFLAGTGSLGRARSLRWSGVGFDRGVWTQGADLGWLGLRVAEARGGVGLGVTEMCALCEVLGGGLVPEPFAETIALAPLLPGDMLDAVLSGERSGLPMAGSDATPSARLEGGRLHARARAVRMGGGADLFAVPVEQGTALVEVAANGVVIADASLQDGGHCASLAFDGAPARVVPVSIVAAMEEITLATAAYLLGVMRRAFEITREYLSTRRQFGKPIGSFQVLQHRMADLYIQIELAAASVAQAATLLDEVGEPVPRLRAVSRAKARASDAAMLVTKQSIQLHGGIGFTDEADIGLFLRKALVLANSYGTPTAHRERYAASLDWGARALAA